MAKDKLFLAERGQGTLTDQIDYALFDEDGRLHSSEQAAIKWDDESRGYFIEGVLFDPRTWEAIIKGTLTPSEAVHLTNAEQRRIAIKRIGVNKMLESLAAEVIDTEGDYVLYKLNLYDDIELRFRVSWRTGRTNKKPDRIYLPAKFLRMKDSTTDQTYFLRVPSDARTCKQSVAWTFGLEPETYSPLIQT